jgi:uncharacterized protein (DUF1800 family)
MARSLQENIAHLLRRAGFGASPEELAAYTALGYAGAVERLVNYEQVPDDVDSHIGKPGYVPLIPDNQAAAYFPNFQIQQARARWLFRMLYTGRPLQEKMALFWHNHFATGYSKIAGDTRPQEATRLMAAVPAEDPAQQMGQIELFRSMALASFPDLLLAVTKDPAILYWLDGRLNVKATPQENYAREVMELFTMGVGNYTEDDVKAAARVFTGWNLRQTPAGTIPVGNKPIKIFQHTFFYDARQHDTNAKTFTFSIYDVGATPNVIPPRPATGGLQDGLDFLAALVRNPATANRLATKLYRFFVNDVTDPPGSTIAAIAGWLRSSNFNMRQVMSQLFTSDFFLAEENFSARYRWPVEHVVGLMKNVGPGLAPLTRWVPVLSQMGEDLYDPPTVEGYKAGATWINSGAMLVRSNFGGALVMDQRDAITDSLVTNPLPTPEALVDLFLARLGPVPVDGEVHGQLVDYVKSGAGTPWTGSRDQVRAKVPGLLHLIAGTGDYAFV